MSEIKDRILEILKKEGIMPSRFAHEIGVQKSAISHILNGRNKPGYDLIKKILKRFNRINAEWLILGEGEMYKKDKDYDNSLLLQENKIGNNKNKIGNEHYIDNQCNNLNDTNLKIQRIIIIYEDGTFTDHINKSLLL